MIELPYEEAPPLVSSFNYLISQFRISIRAVFFGSMVVSNTMVSLLHYIERYELLPKAV